MSIVTQLPNILARTRTFIIGRSKDTWHGDLHTQKGGGGGGRPERGGGWEYRWLCGRVFTNQSGVGIMRNEW